MSVEEVERAAKNSKWRIAAENTDAGRIEVRWSGFGMRDSDWRFLYTVNGYTVTREEVIAALEE